MINRPYS